MRVIRYSVSVAAAILLLVAGAWMFLGHGMKTPWAAAMDRLASTAPPRVPFACTAARTAM